MKIGFVLMAAWLVLLLLSSCAAGPAPATPALATALPRSLKGYELYSWPEGQEWRFALLPGTNRVKTVEEIKASANAVSGLEAARRELARLPQGEEVFWGMRTLDFSFPPRDQMQQIQDFCTSAGIRLTITQGG